MPSSGSLGGCSCCAWITSCSSNLFRCYLLSEMIFRWLSFVFNRRTARDSHATAFVFVCICVCGNWIRNKTTAGQYGSDKLRLQGNLQVFSIPCYNRGKKYCHRGKAPDVAEDILRLCRVDVGLILTSESYLWSG